MGLGFSEPRSDAQNGPSTASIDFTDAADQKPASGAGDSPTLPIDPRVREAGR